jgi:hypothetical protein
MPSECCHPWASYLHQLFIPVHWPGPWLIRGLYIITAVFLNKAGALTLTFGRGILRRSGKGMLRVFYPFSPRWVCFRLFRISCIGVYLQVWF